MAPPSFDMLQRITRINLFSHGLNNKQGSLTTYERWDMSKKSKKTWSLESIPDPEERNWAGHSMVVCNLML